MILSQFTRYAHLNFERAILSITPFWLGVTWHRTSTSETAAEMRNWEEAFNEIKRQIEADCDIQEILDSKLGNALSPANRETLNRAYLESKRITERDSAETVPQRD